MTHHVFLTRQKGPEDFDEDDFRRKVPRYSKENFPNILKLAEGLKRIGERHGATAGQVALAWLLAQGDDVIPIPGTRKQKVRRLPIVSRLSSLTVHCSVPGGEYRCPQAEADPGGGGGGARDREEG